MVRGGRANCSTYIHPVGLAAQNANMPVSGLSRLPCSQGMGVSWALAIKYTDAGLPVQTQRSWKPLGGSSSKIKFLAWQGQCYQPQPLGGRLQLRRKPQAEVSSSV